MNIIRININSFQIIIVLYCFSPCFIEAFTVSCGIDNSPIRTAYEGKSEIETYPWLGILYYPRMKQRFTTGVVLVTRQIVLAAATEIDTLPKDDFRARARVILGRNCSGRRLKIRDYTYHPDYSSKTFSALSLIQLETDITDLELRPICPPPSYFNNPKIFAMVLPNDCRDSRIMLYKMLYVSLDDCKSFYRRSNLDDDSIWPTHTACARSMAGGRCLWRSGAILVTKVGNRWRLLGFGVYGPGCEAPSRFLDYGMYRKWVTSSVRRMGRTSITTIDDNHVVLRRMAGNIQRFGPCDREEMLKDREIYSDTEEMGLSGFDLNKKGVFTYNVSLYTNMEYSCVTFKADYTTATQFEKPKMKIQRWCAGSSALCFGFGFLSIHFHISVEFTRHFAFKLRAYGQPVIKIDPHQAIKMINLQLRRPKVISIASIRAKLKRGYLTKKVYIKLY